ncbi:hypothetical protein PR202_gb24531 [Eleusine coracana subsp. coracana]|uniref:PHD-type domain-containing protein n=1 Tax=Eleusine coracana subsp. coracana TaxID=191504 RepID=A0AAV5FIW3_ELECO|nr:hypothetical protein PR202_gb24531 [Eleusine coracana subsp. coracana]
MSDQPIYANGVCTACRAAGLTEVEVLRCFTCDKRWHSACLSNQPALSQVAEWSCPDCSGDGILDPAAPGGAGGELVAAIRGIEGDNSLSEEEKARCRQELVAGSKLPAVDDEDDSNLSCTFCTNLMECPVSVSSCRRGDYPSVESSSAFRAPLCRSLAFLRNRLESQH